MLLRYFIKAENESGDRQKIALVSIPWLSPDYWAWFWSNRFTFVSVETP